jgi:hypothetical protein
MKSDGRLCWIFGVLEGNVPPSRRAASCYLLHPHFRVSGTASSKEVKQVNPQGQLSIGKKYSGKKFEIQEYSDGTLVLRSVEIISEFELWLPL